MLARARAVVFTPLIGFMATLSTTDNDSRMYVLAKQMTTLETDAVKVWYFSGTSINDPSIMGSNIPPSNWNPLLAKSWEICLEAASIVVSFMDSKSGDADDEDLFGTVCKK